MKILDNPGCNIFKNGNMSEANGLTEPVAGKAPGKAGALGGIQSSVKRVSAKRKKLILYR